MASLVLPLHSLRDGRPVDGRRFAGEVTVSSNVTAAATVGGGACEELYEGMQQVELQIVVNQHDMIMI